MSDREISVLVVVMSAVYLGLTLGYRVGVGDWYGDLPPLVGAAGLLGGMLLYAHDRWAGKGWQEALVRIVGLGCLLVVGYWALPLVQSPPQVAGLGTVSAIVWVAGGAVLVALVGTGLAGGSRLRGSPWYVRSLIGVAATMFAGLFGVLLVAIGFF